MPAAEVRLAKLSRPRVGGLLARERLFAGLDRLREHPVVWIAAQPGAGKTTLLASYLETRRVPGIWYQIDGGDDDPASFFHHLGIATQDLKRRKDAHDPLPHLAPEHGADLAGFARRYFRILYARMGRGAALVLDNLHEIPEDRPLHRVLAAAFEEIPEGVGVLVASRQEPPPAYAPLIARDRLGFVESSEIRLTLEETGEIAGARADLDSATVRRLHEYSQGWAAGITLLVERARRGEPIEAGRAAGALQQVFGFFAQQLIAQDFAADVESLRKLAILPRVTVPVAVALTGDPHAGKLLERLHRRHLFTQRRAGAAGPSYELHALLRAYLRHDAEQAWSADDIRKVVAGAGRLLEADSGIEDAVPLYREIGDWDGVARVALARATLLIAQGRNRTLREWIEAIPMEIRAAQPRLDYWLGSARATEAPREARVELARAHEGFTAAGDELGRVLAATGVVYTYYLDMAQLREMDPWVAEVSAAIDAGARFPTPAMELHVQAALLFGLCFRQPDPRRIATCVARMFELVEHPAIGANEKLAAAAVLLFDCFHHSNLEAGTRLVALISPLVESPEVTPAVRALWWIQVGYWACTCCDTAAGVKAFEASMRTCADNGLAIPVLDVYVQMGLAFTAVFSGDLARADAYRQRAEQHWKSFRLIDVAASAMFKGMLASHRGDLEAARGFAREHYEMAVEAGVQWQAHNALLHCAFVANEQRRYEDAREFTCKARELVAGTVYERFNYQATLLDAYGCLLRGEHEALRASLAEGLAAGRTEPAKFFLRMMAGLLPRLYSAALDLGIEVELVRRSIRELRIAPPSPDVGAWPWPYEVRTLGRFEVLRDGLPLGFSRKAPRKTLQLLKAIIAAGGSNVPEQTLLDALWPDEEGDSASKSLGAAVLRLRALLGDAEVVVQQAGTFSLDRTRTWVDVWAFEGSGRIDLYKGSFLAEEEGVPWPVPMRERLRARFIQRLAEAGAGLEREGRHEAAIEAYMRGLDADSIVEPFYQGLMRCYARLDRRPEAAAAYRRLKQVLSVTLGLLPSATTERLYRSLHLDPAGIPNP